MAITKNYSKNASVCKLTFEVAHPEAKSIALLGDFNQWSPEKNLLKKKKDGSFGIEIELPVGKSYEFRYLVDQKTWQNDAQGDAYTWTRVCTDANFVVNIAAPADDLTIIEGIGPAAAKVLIAAGIETFASLAKADATEVKNILVAANSRVGHLDPTSWAQQAELAANGQFAELEDLKKVLINGKAI